MLTGNPGLRLPRHRRRRRGGRGLRRRHRHGLRAGRHLRRLLPLRGRRPGRGLQVEADPRRLEQPEEEAQVLHQAGQARTRGRSGLSVRRVRPERHLAEVHAVVPADVPDAGIDRQPRRHARQRPGNDHLAARHGRARDQVRGQQVQGGELPRYRQDQVPVEGAGPERSGQPGVPDDGRGQVHPEVRGRRERRLRDGRYQQLARDRGPGRHLREPGPRRQHPP